MRATERLIRKQRNRLGGQRAVRERRAHLSGVAARERAHRECFADNVRVAGTLVAREESFARPDADGQRITQVLVEDGDVVLELPEGPIPVNE